MKMKLTVSKLRENIYQILDSVLQTGRSVDVERKGKRLRISPVEPGSKLQNLKRRNTIVGDPEALVHVDWTKEWKN